MATPQPPISTRDRFRGALLGLAVGEAMGAPVEFLTADQIMERYGLVTQMIGGGVYDLAPGQTIDATDMTLCLAESLADVGGFDPEDVMERYRVTSVLVTDADGVLVGALNSNDLMRAKVI